MLKKYLKTGIIIFITSLLMSCDATPKNKLLGKWVDKGQEKSGDYIEFSADNTVVMHTKLVPDPVSGTWSISPDNSVKADFKVTPSTNSINMLLKFEDEHLISIGVNGVKETLVKL